MTRQFFFAACLLTITSVLSPSATFAKEPGKLIFSDDFSRNESQELTDEVGNGWGTNSAKRAGGNKQVDLKDGTMRIYIHETADHGVSVTHPVEFRDGRIEIKFMLEHEKDSLGLNFADQQYKKVWAGHLFKVIIGAKQTVLTDLKTGVMDLKIREARQAKTITVAQQKMLKTKSKRIPHQLEKGKWYIAVAKITGDKLSVSIDGKVVGSFSSEGIAHPTKRMLRLAVNRNVVVDDLKIYSQGK